MESLINKIEIFENEYDIYKRISQELEDHKVSLSHQWDDNASREINSKYLFLFSDNCEYISKNYSDQIQKIRLLNDLKINIENKCEEIKNLSTDINLYLNQCLKLRESSGSFLQDAYLKESDTNTLFNKTTVLFKEIEKLNNKHLDILKST
jgi:hypothetical protein